MMMMMMGKKERKAQTQKLFFLPGFFTHDAQLNHTGGKEDQTD